MSSSCRSMLHWGVQTNSSLHCLATYIFANVNLSTSEALSWIAYKSRCTDGADMHSRKFCDCKLCLRFITEEWAQLETIITSETILSGGVLHMNPQKAFVPM